MNHLDLFSGIGGFSLALDNIFYEMVTKLEIKAKLNKDIISLLSQDTNKE